MFVHSHFFRISFEIISRIQTCAPQFKLYGLRVKCWTLIHWILSSSFDECICDFFCSQIETFTTAKAETLEMLSLIPPKRFRAYKMLYVFFAVAPCLGQFYQWV
jgi:hypothetical protein